MAGEFLVNRIPGEEIYNRVFKLQEHLLGEGIGGALIVQKADLFYFSGTCQDAHLFIPDRGEPTLMVRRNYERAEKESALENIVEVQNFKEMGNMIARSTKSNDRLGLELDVIPYNLFLKYKEMLKPAEIVDISPAVRRIRMIKTPYEIEILKEAGRLSKEVFEEIPDFIKEGMTEAELGARIEYLLRLKGHQGLIRTRAFNQEGTAHILSGWTSAYASFFDGPTGGAGLGPHFPQGPSCKRIGRHEPIVVDFATVFRGYVFDQTRIFSIGPLPDKLLEAHETALRIKRKTVCQAVPGSNGKELYNTAQSMAQKAGLASHFMGYGQGVSFVGHGVGLELDELPVIAKNFDIVLQPGMVFALEPKFSFPGEGTVGVEDTFLVTASGTEQLNQLEDAVTVL